jgi:hypothetical protein
MIDDNWQMVSLRIFSEILEPEEITKFIGCSPTQFHKKGELMSFKNPNSQKRTHNSWILESDLPNSVSFEKHIINIISFLENKINIIIKLKEKCHIDIVCALSIKGNQGSFELNSEIIQRLSAIHLNIVFDLYVDDTE